MESYISVLPFLGLSKREFQVLIFFIKTYYETQNLEKILKLDTKELVFFTGLNRNVLEHTCMGLSDLNILFKDNVLLDLPGNSVSNKGLTLGGINFFIKINEVYVFNSDWGTWIPTQDSPLLRHINDEKPLIFFIKNCTLPNNYLGIPRERVSKNGITAITLRDQFVLEYKKAYLGEEYKSTNWDRDMIILKRVIGTLCAGGLQAQSAVEFISWCFGVKSLQFSGKIYIFNLPRFLNEYMSTTKEQKKEAEVRYQESESIGIAEAI